MLLSNVKEVNPFLFCESSEPTRTYDLLFCENCMACESQTYEMNPILILKCSEPISPYNLFLQKLVGTWDLTINVVNPILFCKHRNSSTPLTCFCINYKMPESNVNKVNPILVASAVSPSAPMTCFFFVKIALCMRVKHKTVNPTFFCEFSKPTLAYDLFYVKIAWFVSQM